MKKFIPILGFSLLLIVSCYYFVVFFLPFEILPIPSSTVFLDARGKEIGEIIYSGSVRHREIPYGEIPDFYKKALITMEDRTFWNNNGISLGGIARSTIHNIEAGKITEGASTLSSGLVRNILWIGESRTISRKIFEFLYAVRLNHLYSKEKILTEYVDRIGFGYMNYGLQSAAKYYFDRKTLHLTKAEQIALLVLPKDPKKYDPYLKPKNFRDRFETIVNALGEQKILTEAEKKEVLAENLAWNTDHENSLPFVIDFLKSEIKTGLNQNPIQTTFDQELTEKIDGIAKHMLEELAWRNVGDYGILIAERINITPLTKEGRGDFSNPQLRVMIGGADYHESTTGQVNTTLALRQPGSTIKPFTYTLAFEKLGLTQEDTILDLPTAYKTSENYSYEPKNYTQDYKGEITLRQALAGSINIPAVKLAEKVGVQTLLDFLRSLGITSLTKNSDHYGLSLTLGDGEISLFELLQAYTIFANNGQFCPFQILAQTNSEQKKNCTTKINPKYTDMVVSILTDRYAKLGGFPLNSSLDFADRTVFVKTGTSRNFRDNWTVGFTDHYMIGVWTGNKSGKNMKGVSGASGAGEIFRKIVYALEPIGEEQKTKNLPPKSQNYLTITNPLHGSVYKEDVSKTSEQQKIQLRLGTNIPYDATNWLLDGIKISDTFIKLTRGKHTIEIILSKNSTIVGKEKNTFTVEGIQ